METNTDARQKLINELMTELWRPRNGRTPEAYMVIDCARDKKIYTLLEQLSLFKTCLFGGTLNYRLERAAPHLIKLKAQHKDSRTLLDRAWGNGWGIFLIKWPPLFTEDIRLDLKKVMRISNPKGKRHLFRFYDPVILRTFLPTCEPKECNTMFGRLDDFLYEGEQNEIIRYRRDQEALVNVYNNPSAFEQTVTPVRRLTSQQRMQVLTIRPEQMRVFELQRLEKFTQAVGEHVKQSFPEHSQILINNNDFDDWLIRHVEKALSLQFNTEQAIIRFVNVTVFHGEDIDKKDWAQEIFEQNISPTAKAIALENAGIEQLKQLQNDIRSTLNNQRERRLLRFVKQNIYKVHCTSAPVYGINFNSENEERAWLRKVGTQALEFGLKRQSELSLWLDLALTHGENFFEQDWAKTATTTDDPSEQLLGLLTQQPHSKTIAG